MSLHLSELQDKANGYRNNPTQGFGLEYLRKLLELVTCERRSSYVYMHSPYRFKKATLDMLAWCIERKLIERKADHIRIVNGRRYKDWKVPPVYYVITEEGRKFLGVLS